MQDRFGRYEVVRRLARGGMAEVLLARLVGPGGFLRPVVIKRILPAYANDRAFVEMFLDEARIAASIRHPNVIHVEDLGLHDGEPYIVMEYVAGESVAALIQHARMAQDPLHLALAIHIVSEMLAGLRAAHELKAPSGEKRGVVHRDVSPQNVMLTYDGHVKVLDFGIARAENRLAKTSTGEVKGKVAYMAPEQCRGEPLDARADIFSAGVMLYELVTLHHPFRRAEEAATLVALFAGEYAPLGEAGGRFAPDLERILGRSMTPAKERRYASAAEMRRDLSRLSRGLAGDEPMEALLASRMARAFADTVAHTAALAPTATAPRRELETAPPAPTPTPTGSGRRVGRYLIHDLLGMGGMAEVFYGTLSAAGGISRPVAIKKLYPQLVADPEARTILLDEARLVARVQHPNVVSLLDVVEEHDDLFLVLEYVAGETVASLRRIATGPVEAPIAVGIAIGALEGLHAAHVATDASGASLGIVHRDVSPQNIIVGVDGMARVLDFGIAKAQGRAQQATRTGLIKGKLEYMAPEQLRTGLATVRSDVFSAAVVLWELLVGKRLFEGDSDVALRTQVLTRSIPRLGELIATTPALEAVLDQALARDPAVRFASAGDFAAALEHAVTPATPRRIAAWLEAQAAPVLAERAAAVRRYTTEERAAGPAPRERDLESAAHKVALSIDTPAGLTPVDLALEATRRTRRRAAATMIGVSVLGLGAVLGIGRFLGESRDDGRGPATGASLDVAQPNAASAAVVEPMSTAQNTPVVEPEPPEPEPREPEPPRPSAAAAAIPRPPARAPASRSAPLPPTASASPSCKLVPQTDARGIVTFQRICK